MNNSLEIGRAAAETAVTASTYEIGLTNLDFVIDRCEICVLSATCDSPTERRSYARFVATSFFFVDACEYSR